MEKIGSRIVFRFPDDCSTNWAAREGANLFRDIFFVQRFLDDCSTNWAVIETKIFIKEKHVTSLSSSKNFHS
jgi:hypothetical protein